jgi:hypothetical protein
LFFIPRLLNLPIFSQVDDVPKLFESRLSRTDFSFLPNSEFHPFLQQCEDAGLTFEIEFPKAPSDGNLDTWRIVDRDIMEKIELTPVKTLPPQTDTGGKEISAKFPSHPSSTRWAIASAALGRANNRGDALHRLRPINSVIPPLNFMYDTIHPFTIPNPLLKNETQGRRMMFICEYLHMQPNESEAIHLFFQILAGMDSAVVLLMASEFTTRISRLGLRVGKLNMGALVIASSSH